MIQNVLNIQIKMWHALLLGQKLSSPAKHWSHSPFIFCTKSPVTRSEYSVGSVDATVALNSLIYLSPSLIKYTARPPRPVPTGQLLPQRTSKLEKAISKQWGEGAQRPTTVTPSDSSTVPWAKQTALHLAAQGNGISCIGINQKGGYHCAKHGQPLILGVKLHLFWRSQSCGKLTKRPQVWFRTMRHDISWTAGFVWNCNGTRHTRANGATL